MPPVPTELAAGAAGLAAGLGAGALVVVIERASGLARRRGDAPHPGLPGERFGWSRLEWGVAPLVVALSGVAIAATGVSLVRASIGLLWIAVLVHIGIFDLRHRLVLNWVVLPATALALALAPLTPGLRLGGALAGAALLGLLIGLPAMVTGMMGMGDAKLCLLIGAVVGVGGGRIRALDALLAGIVLAGIIILGRLATGGLGRRSTVAYAPFLSAGAIAVIIATAAGWPLPI